LRWNAALKLKIWCEKLLIIPRRFFGIPPFHFYALTEGIAKGLWQTRPDTPTLPSENWQMELLLAWEGQKNGESPENRRGLRLGRRGKGATRESGNYGNRGFTPGSLNPLA
jgi:hypothetical protein